MGQSLARAIEVFSPRLPLAVAYSGGADSTALLLACAEKWPGQVVAIHVHHGIQAAADGFASHCESVCKQLNVPLTIRRVDGRPVRGQSPEDAARRARYRAFVAAFAEGIVAASSAGIDGAGSAEGKNGKNGKNGAENDKNNDFSHVEYRLFAIKNKANLKIRFKSIAIAQHADDQVETVLLALGRGAGLAGLAGMPAQWERDGIRYHRPWLGVSRTDIRAWLAAQSLPCIEDPSNADERFTRNRIRARVVPALQAVFPHFLDTFSRSAAHAAQAQKVLDDVGQQDLAAMAASATVGPGADLDPVDSMNPADMASPAAPIIAHVQKLSQPRQANALRFWLKSQYSRVPSAAQLDELLRQVAACTTRGHQINIKVADGYVRRRGNVLAWYNS